MPNASASTIRTALNTQLSAVTELKGGVSIGRTAVASGFPAARFYLSGVHQQPEDADTATNYRVYVFTIDILMAVTINGVTKSASEGELEDAIDAVMDRLATNWSLGGVLEASSMESSQVRYEEIAQGVAAFLPLTFYAKTLVSL